MSEYLESTARLSSDGRYRYALTRVWSKGLAGRLVVIGLNPSTADADQDDPTIRRCVGFAKREAMGGLVMVNLFALRATNPEVLWEAYGPIGPENDQVLTEVCWEHGLTGILLAAWGAHRMAAPRARAVFDDLQHTTQIQLRCLGVTKHGAPRHPLYVPARAPLLEYQVPA